MDCISSFSPGTIRWPKIRYRTSLGVDKCRSVRILKTSGLLITSHVLQAFHSKCDVVTAKHCSYSGIGLIKVSISCHVVLVYDQGKKYNLVFNLHTHTHNQEKNEKNNFLLISLLSFRGQTTEGVEVKRERELNELTSTNVYIL